MAHYTATVLDDRRLELPQGTLSLITPGQKIEIDLADTAFEGSPKPNEKALAVMQDLANWKKDMPESDPSDTNRIIREGRSGAMYGE
jgi:hypothetical protein